MVEKYITKAKAALTVSVGIRLEKKKGLCFFFTALSLPALWGANYHTFSVLKPACRLSQKKKEGHNGITVSEDASSTAK